MKKLILQSNIVDILSLLPAEQLGRVMLWIMEYNEYGYFPKYDKDIDNAINNIKVRIQCNEMISEKRKAAGRKGGNPNLVKQNPILDNQKVKQNTNLVKQNEDLVKQNPILDNQKVKQNEISDNIYNINNNLYSLNNNKEKINKKEKNRKDFEKRAKAFYDSLIPFIDNPYPKEMLRDFYDYWSEPNKSYSKMKWEQQTTWDLARRLARWENNDKKRNYGNSKPAKPTIEETAADLIDSYLNGSRSHAKLPDL